MRRHSLIALLATTSLAFAFTSAAQAADMPARMAVKAPPPVLYTPPFSWTGFYIGANAGWGWSSGDGTITMGPRSGPISGSGNGFLGGVQAGYNWQTGPIVFGVETDFQGSSGSGDVTGNAGATRINGTVKTPWFGTIRGRVGYAQDRWLFYVTGGGVYGQSNFDGTLSTTGAFSSSANYWTYTVGGGVEAMLWDRWSAKLEYLYVGTPDKSPTPPGTSDLTGNVHTNIVRVGLNYHF